MQPISGLHVASLIDPRHFDVRLHHEDWHGPFDPTRCEGYDLVFLSYDAAPADDGKLEIVGGLLLVPEVVGTATVVPEPKSAALLVLGLAFLARLRRRARA